MSATDKTAPVNPRYSEGTWSSPGYRSGRTRAQWSKAFLLFAAAASALQVVLALQGAGLVGADSQSTQAEIDAYGEAVTTGDSLFLLAWVGMFITLLAWLSRTVDIVPALGGGTPRDSPRWAIGWWFIPIANLWKPYLVVREVWDRLATPTRSVPPTSVLVWWLLLIGAVFVSNVVDRLLVPETVGDLQGLFYTYAVFQALAVGAAVFGFFVVGEVQARADERALGFGFDAPAPQYPSAQQDPTAQQASPRQGPAEPGPAPGDPTPSSAKASFCPACGAPRVGQARYCASCGRDLTAPPSTE